MLSENPPVLKAYFEKLEVIMRDESLTPLTKEFISIGAAAALGAEHCLATHLKVARVFGATNDQLNVSHPHGFSDSGDKRPCHIFKGL